MEIALTRMSTKGQIVIPTDMREDIDEGEKLILIKTDEQIIVKKASDLDEQLKEDLEFARRTEEALERYEKGEFIEMSLEEFSAEIEKW